MLKEVHIGYHNRTPRMLSSCFKVRDITVVDFEMENYTLGIDFMSDEIVICAKRRNSKGYWSDWREILRKNVTRRKHV